MLLEADPGAVNAQDVSGHSPVYYAMMYQLPLTTELLLQCARLDPCRVSAGKSLQEAARESKCPAVMDIVLRTQVRD